MKKRALTIILLSALIIVASFAAWLAWENFWLRRTVDYLADEAGAGQAMSEFRHGQLVLWETVPTNDFPRFSGRYDGPFQIWFDEYHPDLPSVWHYGQLRHNEAHNTQMKLMHKQPAKFKFNFDSNENLLITTNALRI